MQLDQNRPVVGAALTGLLSPFLYALGDWALTAVPEGVPAEVLVTGRALLVFLLGLAGAGVGLLVQRHTWAEDTHRAAVAYALHLDPSMGKDLLAQLGLDSVRQAREFIGLDPEGPV